MKKMLALAITLIMAISLTACSSNTSGIANGQAANSSNVDATEKNSLPNTKTENTDQTQGNLAKKKILIAYFSHSGNTREIANQIHEKVGGDLFEIVTVDPYPTNYDATVDQAKREQQNNYKPKLAKEVKNMDSYDVIFVGYPNWWGTMPMALFTFLEGYNFSGKTIIPFITHDGSRLGRSVNDIRALCPQATILEGLAIKGSDAKNAQNDVSAWLRKLGMTD